MFVYSGLPRELIRRPLYNPGYTSLEFQARVAVSRVEGEEEEEEGRAGERICV